MAGLEPIVGFDGGEYGACMMVEVKDVGERM